MPFASELFDEPETAAFGHHPQCRRSKVVDVSKVKQPILSRDRGVQVGTFDVEFSAVLQQSMDASEACLLYTSDAADE